MVLGYQIYSPSARIGIVPEWNENVDQGAGPLANQRTRSRTVEAETEVYSGFGRHAPEEHNKAERSVSTLSHIRGETRQSK